MNLDKLIFENLCDDLKLIQWGKLSNTELAQLSRSVNYASRKIDKELIKREMIESEVRAGVRVHYIKGVGQNDR